MPSSKPLNRHQAAVLLSNLRLAIFDDWEKRTWTCIGPARHPSRPALRDSLPRFIDRLVITLKSNDPHKESDLNTEVACEYAQDRANHSDYSLDQVVSEYHIMRSVIIQQVGREHDIDRAARECIHRFIDLGVAKATVTFHEIEVKYQWNQKREIEASRLAAEHANQAKSDFFVNMSHEIRAPLGAIMGFLDLLKNTKLEQTEIAKHIAVIERNSNDLLRIIDDISDVSQIDVGNMQIPVEIPLHPKVFSP